MLAATSDELMASHEVGVEQGCDGPELGRSGAGYVPNRAHHSLGQQARQRNAGDHPHRAR